MTTEKKIYEELSLVQKTLVVPKNQFNKFGGYNFRSCEDIIEGLKKVMSDGYSVTINDKMVEIGGRVYVESVASFNDSDGNSITASASAREQEKRKGMDESQVTGATSSYSRKYALNALFAIDDTKDADNGDNAGEPEVKFISMDQQTVINDLIKEVKADKLKMLNYFDVTNLGELPITKFKEATNLLELKRG